MKTKSLIISVIAFFISISAFSQAPSFNGVWKIDRQKSAVPSDQLFLSKINIKINGDSLYTTRVYEDPNGQEYPFDENFLLNGSESNTVIYEMPRVSKAQKGNDDTIVIDSKTTFNGNGGDESLISKETWKVSPDGVLSMEFTNQMSGQEYKGTFYYNKGN